MTATYTIGEAAQLLGISKSAAYKVASTEDFPVPVIKIGGRYVVPRKPLDELLGLNDSEAGAA